MGTDIRKQLSGERKGIVLIVVLGTLALMSVLALTFVSMMRLERSISANYVDRTRAVFAAESGVEAAIAKLGKLQAGVLPPEEFEWLEYNPDNPTAGLAEAEKLSFMAMEAGPGGMAISGAIGGSHIEKGDHFLLRVADESGKLNLNDSNALMDPNDPLSGRLFHIVRNLAEILFADDKGAGIGTAVASAIFAERDRLGQFSMLLQIDEVLNSLDFSRSQREKFLLNITLWSWRDPDGIKPIPAWGSYDDAKTLYGNPSDDDFPKYGFPFMRWEEVQSFNDGDDANGSHDHGYQLEPRSPVNVNTASKELIQALLAGLEGWTVFEGPSERYQRSSWGGTLYYGGWSIWGLYKGGLGTGDFICGYSNFLFETTARDETLFRNAADKIILDENCIADLKPLTLPFARMRSTKIPDLSDNAGFSAVLAEDLYHRIHGLDIYPGNQDPVENWREFKFYLDNVIARAKAGELPNLAIDDPFTADESEATWTYGRSGDFQYFNEYYRDLILANFDPNTMTNDFNPDLVVYRHTDKADLINYSTEFCFEPTGAFKIESLGKVVDGSATSSNRAVAEVTAVVKLFGFKRLTTQAQLVGNDISPDAMEEMFGRNESANATKWANIVGGTNGARLVSHPEPIAKSLPDKFAFVKNGHFDGRIGLATIKNNNILSVGDNEIPAALWSHFEGSMQAENPSGTVPSGLPSENGSFLKFNTPAAISIYQNDGISIDPVAEELRECENPLLTPHTDTSSNLKPGTLYVDGVFSSAWKCPAYPVQALGYSHLSDDTGYGRPREGGLQTLFLMIKPGFMMKDSNRSRNFFNLGQGGGGNMMTFSRLRFDYCLPSAWPRIYPDEDQHPLTIGFGWAPSCVSRGLHFPRTNFVGTGIDLTRDYAALGRAAYHFEGHRWNLLAASWSFPDNLICAGVNGQAADYDYRYPYVSMASTLAVPFTLSQDGPEQFTAPIRLGAFSRSQGMHKIYLFEPADSTYGEFFLYKEALDENSFAIQIDLLWDEGFYYHDPGEPAIYTTPEIDFGAKPGRPVTIRSISWTGRWSQYVRANAVNDDEYFDPVWGQLEEENQWPDWLTANFSGDDPGKWAPFLVDIKTDDTWHYEDDETKMINSGGSMPMDTDGYKLKTDDGIQLKFYFNLADDQVEPLRESPYLDDITITYIPARGMKFLFYQMH
ncbi:PilX N-terminal domain-containing pilus assembly protein [Planctomycetota bacterium]